jgi:hypothetical protein|tara:strand:+ start:863 stop:1171 length:309 start_codon:yes stop_codon:yes gene_type:complete
MLSYLLYDKHSNRNKIMSEFTQLYGEQGKVLFNCNSNDKLVFAISKKYQVKPDTVSIVRGKYPCNVKYSYKDGYHLIDMSNNRLSTRHMVDVMDILNNQIME